MGLVRITYRNWSQYGAGIEAIEAGSEYPIGADFFRINHGNDYFAFFKRLGDVHYYAWIESGIVTAVAASILRELPNGGKRAWYLCDLKVHPEYRGRRIPLRMLTRGALFNYLRCSRAYAISMNSQSGESGRAVKLLERYRWLRFGQASKLLIWSLEKQDMSRAIPIIEKHRGPISFLSLNGVKDIVLKSTGLPLRLLHAQFGVPDKKKGIGMEDGAVHMFCSPEHDPLTQEIQTELKLASSASATIISHRMKNSDWRWVLTSEI